MVKIIDEENNLFNITNDYYKSLHKELSDELDSYSLNIFV